MATVSLGGLQVTDSGTPSDNPELDARQTSFSNIFEQTLGTGLTDVAFTGFEPPTVPDAFDAGSPADNNVGQRQLQRRGSASQWQSVNPILGVAEIGYETDTYLLKFGDGVSAWNDLPYTDVTTDWLVVDDDYVAKFGRNLFVNSAGGPIQITLPRVPHVNGAIVCRTNEFADGNPVTFLRNGNSIMGLDEDMTIDTPSVEFMLVWDGQTWQISLSDLREFPVQNNIIAALAAPGGGALVGLDIPGSGTVHVQDKLRKRAKTPVVNWLGKRLLWLGTSIPAQGNGLDSYPDLFAASLGCTVTNNAFAGSHARYDVTGAIDDLSTIKALSMTEDDRLAGLALYGAGSVYSDTFDIVTLASQQTCDFRIKAAFAAGAFDVVMFDHAHNDKSALAGTLDPVPHTVTAITKGVNTVVTTSDTWAAVGDAVVLEVTGISNLNHFAGRVQAVAGNQLTLNIDSSGYTGSFVSGTVTKHDRSTIYGSFQFLLHYIKWCAVLYGYAEPIVVLAGAPSNFTINGELHTEVEATAQSLRTVATKWGLSFFDIAAVYDVHYGEQAVFFPDFFHPTDHATRQALANHWIAWAQGGQNKQDKLNAWIPNGTSNVYTEGRAAEYSEYLGGFGTPSFSVGLTVTALAETFAGGIGAWTSVGTAPVAGAAPWGGGESAILCHSAVGATTSYLWQAVTLDEGFSAEFSVWLPAVVGLTTGGTKTVDLAQFRSASGQGYYSVQLLVHTDSVRPRIVYFEAPNATLVKIADIGYELSATTKHLFRWKAVKKTASHPGGVLLYVNDVLVNPYVSTTDNGQAVPGRFYYGVMSCNTGDNFDVYLGPVTLKKSAVADYTLRANGSLRSGDGRAMTLVNGLVTVLGAPSASDLGVMTWATLRDNFPADSYTGYRAFASDIKIYMQSNGTRWEPVNGMAYVKTMGARVTALHGGTEANGLKFQFLPGMLKPFDRILVKGGLSKTGSATTGVQTYRMGTAGNFTEQAIASWNSMSTGTRSTGFDHIIRVESDTSVQFHGAAPLGGAAGGIAAPNTAVYATAVTVPSMDANALWLSANILAGVTDDVVMESCEFIWATAKL